MKAFALDPHLERECHLLGRRGSTHYLLMKYAAVPWFLLVPETAATEIYELDGSEHETLRENIHDLSLFLKAHFPVTKINVASIGNVVKQLHVHVIGRNTTDYCWPAAVWGTTPPERYTEQQIAGIRAMLREHCGVVE